MPPTSNDPNLPSTSSDPVGNVVKLIGELAVVPGASQLLDGNVGSGMAHAVVGWAARILLGAPAMLVVAANSYSRSVSDKSLLTHIRELFSSPEPPRSELIHPDYGNRP